MTPKLLPSATDVLSRTREAFHDLIVPSLVGQSERSASATIDHMLRYVERLIDQQGQTLLDEEIRLKLILSTAAAWLADRDDRDPLAADIQATIGQERDPGIFTTIAMMQDAVAILRQHVCDVLLALQALGDAKGPEGERLHETLRDYIRWQLLEEEKLVEPAFVGHGPRR
jgi:hypothetical protein